MTEKYLRDKQAHGVLAVQAACCASQRADSKPD